MIREHNFTANIRNILNKYFKNEADYIFNSSLLLQYLNEKTISVNKGSKSRSSFGNIYSIYVLVEDYINNNFHKRNNKKLYSEYEGAIFSEIFKRQRELPFGSKLQNHSLNNITNSEFTKFFPTSDATPIIRNQETNRYWINENLLVIPIKGRKFNIAAAIIEIIDEYVNAKQDSFKRFIDQCTELQNLRSKDNKRIKQFIESLLAPNVDARLFEIVSFSILKYYYKDQNIYWGYSLESIKEENLKLYKTGRTNANDGGIDFVMKPLGRFFQVTETLDFKKYFLDIEKIEKYPISFVIKSEEDVKEIEDKIKDSALKTYPVKAIVDKYMDCIEEIINIPILMDHFEVLYKNNQVKEVLDEISLQSKVEFNYSDDEEE